MVNGQRVSFNNVFVAIAILHVLEIKNAMKFWFRQKPSCYLIAMTGIRFLPKFILM